MEEELGHRRGRKKKSKRSKNLELWIVREEMQWKKNNLVAAQENEKVSRSCFYPTHRQTRTVWCSELIPVTFIYCDHVASSRQTTLPIYCMTRDLKKLSYAAPPVSSVPMR
jgi:hypothetical protein